MDKFDQSGFENLIKDYKDFESSFSDLYDMITAKSGLVQTDISSSYGTFLVYEEGFQRKISQVITFLQKPKQVSANLSFNLEKYLNEALSQYDISLFGNSPSYINRKGITGFAYSADQSVSSNYAGYDSFLWSLNGNNFEREYEDMYSFMNSPEYNAQHNAFFGASNYNNYKMMGYGILATLTNDTSYFDYYTDELLEDSIMKVMDEFNSEQGLSGGIDGALKGQFGKNYDYYLGKIAEYLKKASEHEPDYVQLSLKLASDPVLKGYLVEISTIGGLDEDGIADKLIANDDFFEFLAGASKCVSTTQALIEFMDPVFKFAVNLKSDYSIQMEYLNSVQESMLAAGYAYGPVHKAIRNVKQKYSDAADLLLQDLCKSVKKKIGGIMKDSLIKGKKVFSKTAGKEAAKTAGKELTVLGSIDTGLTLTSTVAKLIGSKSIAADKSLMGLTQMDRVLTDTYKHYQSLMEQGLASKSDMEEAEKVFRTLLSTKKQEYKAMMDMTKTLDKHQYALFEKKYNELDNWLQSKYTQGSDLLKDNTLNSLRKS